MGMQLGEDLIESNLDEEVEVGEASSQMAAFKQSPGRLVAMAQVGRRLRQEAGMGAEQENGNVLDVQAE